jgi:hypothetical protein
MRAARIEGENGEDGLLFIIVEGYECKNTTYNSVILALVSGATLANTTKDGDAA